MVTPAGRVAIYEYIQNNINLFDLNKLLHIVYFLLVKNARKDTIKNLLSKIETTYFNSTKEFKEYLLKSSYVKLLSAIEPLDGIDKNISTSSVQRLVDEDELHSALENLQSVTPEGIEYSRELGYKLPDFPVSKESSRIYYVYAQ